MPRYYVRYSTRHRDYEVHDRRTHRMVRAFLTRRQAVNRAEYLNHYH